MSNNNHSSNSGFIYIDSKNRVNTQDLSSEVVVNIQDIYDGIDKSLSIEWLQIPNSFYNINSNYNTFTLAVSGVNHTVTISGGNYTSSQFCSALQTQLGAVATGVSFYPSIDTITGKLGITASSNEQFSITSNSVNGRWLGMNEGQTILFTGITTDTSFTSSNVVDLSGTRYIELQTDIPLDSVNTRDRNKNILARVFVNGNSFDYTTYTSQSFQFVKLNTNKLNHCRFKLLDEWGYLLDLNGNEWSMSLETVALIEN